MNILSRRAPALAVALFCSALLPFIQGCGGGCSGVVGPFNCVTNGNPATAYISSNANSQMCPAGWQCIPMTDTDPKNAAALQACRDSVHGGTPTPTPIVAHPVVRPTPFPGTAPAAPQPNPNLPTPLKPTPVAPAPTGPAPKAPTAVLAPTPLASCLKQCSSPAGSASCTSFALSAAQASLAAQLAKIVIQERRPQIETPLLMRAFQVAADPCQRGPVLQNGARLTNSGGACMIRTSLPAISANVLIELPASLDAAISVSGTETLFRFGSVTSRPSLHLMDSTHPSVFHRDNARLGGAILQVEADPSRIFVRTASACIWAAYAGPN